MCDFDGKNREFKMQQKSKNKRITLRITLVRNVRLFLAQSNSQWDGIDQACLNKYRMKGVLKINKVESQVELKKMKKYRNMCLT